MTQNIFGTDGIRNTMGTKPFDYQGLTQLGIAIGKWARQRYTKESPAILLGYDTRQSCAFANAALQTGLLLNHATIYDAGVVPTPAICQLIKNNRQFDLGIIISASHNPYQDNGIKLVDAVAGKLSAQDELEISALFYQAPTMQFDYTTLGTTILYTDVYEQYCATIARYFQPNYLHGLIIVLDCANGATYKFAENIFSHFGAQVYIINNTPDGKNINQNCGSLHIEYLQEAVLKHGAHIGFAFDGDGDRVIAVNRYGHIKDGDDILALLLIHSAYANQKGIVGTVMTNQGFQVHLENQNKFLIRTHVGDKFVAEQLEKEKMLLGGEQSGHIILRDYLSIGDGIFTALRLVQAILETDNWTMATFEKFPQILINIPIGIKKDLAQPQLKEIILEHEAQLHKGRLLVRYSGTEAILRVMVEDADLAHAKSIGKKLSEKLAQNLLVI